MFNGKTHYRWPFSIAVCMFTRGYILRKKNCGKSPNKKIAGRCSSGYLPQSKTIKKNTLNRHEIYGKSPFNPIKSPRNPTKSPWNPWQTPWNPIQTPLHRWKVASPSTWVQAKCGDTEISCAAPPAARPGMNGRIMGYFTMKCMDIYIYIHIYIYVYIYDYMITIIIYVYVFTWILYDIIFYICGYLTMKYMDI